MSENCPESNVEMKTEYNKMGGQVMTEAIYITYRNCKKIFIVLKNKVLWNLSRHDAQIHAPEGIFVLTPV